MPRYNLAEWVLTLVISQECAASAVGDLLEENQVCGLWWFWCSVAHIALLRLWQQIAGAPFRAARVAIHGLFVQIGILLCWYVGFVMAAWIAISTSIVYFHSPLGDMPPWATQWLAIPFMFFLKNLLVPLQVGRWMARRYPGREVSGAMTLAGLHAGTTICAWITWAIILKTGGTAQLDITFYSIPLIAWDGVDIFEWMGTVVFVLALLAGAAYERTKSFRAPVLLT
jgi:hypothetical protein